MGKLMMMEIQNFESKTVCSESPLKESVISDMVSDKSKKKKKKKKVDKGKILINVCGTDAMLFYFR
jgi:hypothetical protein